MTAPQTINLTNEKQNLWNKMSHIMRTFWIVPETATEPQVRFEPAKSCHQLNVREDSTVILEWWYD